MTKVIITGMVWKICEYRDTHVGEVKGIVRHS